MSRGEHGVLSHGDLRFGILASRETLLSNWLESREPHGVAVGGHLLAALAPTLMAHAQANPDRIRAQLRPVAVDGRWSGRQAFAVALRKMRE
jgi:hypothetical protein